jgi:hypothetical protein
VGEREGEGKGEEKVGKGKVWGKGKGGMTYLAHQYRR